MIERLDRKFVPAAQSLQALKKGMVINMHHQEINLIRSQAEDIPYSPVLEAIKETLRKEEPCIVAIDGLCGSGKSTLAAILKERFDCNVFHMDDYFLPKSMKTKERLAEPGGNVHYERFQEEVLASLLRQETVTYRPYNCVTASLEAPITVEHKKLTIIEGTYVLHPTLRHAATLKVFLTADEKEQLKRIKQRSGEEKLQQFIQLWIPLETRYFQELKIEDLCDLVLDTTNFTEE